MLKYFIVGDIYEDIHEQHGDSSTHLLCITTIENENENYHSTWQFQVALTLLP